MSENHFYENTHHLTTMGWGALLNDGSPSVAMKWLASLTHSFFGCFQIWVRNYQIVEEQPESAKEAHQAKKEEGKASKTSLVEIGPRFVLNPIRIFKGSFGGPTLYQNPEFISPNTLRALERRKKGSVYMDRRRSKDRAKERKEQLVVPEDPLASVFH